MNHTLCDGGSVNAASLLIYFEIRTHFYFDMTKKTEVASVSSGKRRK